jgi:hypothetical protein
LFAENRLVIVNERETKLQFGSALVVNMPGGRTVSALLADPVRPPAVEENLFEILPS